MVIGFIEGLAYMLLRQSLFLAEVHDWSYFNVGEIYALTSKKNIINN